MLGVLGQRYAMLVQRSEEAKSLEKALETLKFRHGEEVALLKSENEQLQSILTQRLQHEGTAMALLAVFTYMCISFLCFYISMHKFLLAR